MKSILELADELGELAGVGITRSPVVQDLDEERSVPIIKWYRGNDIPWDDIHFTPDPRLKF